MTTGFEHIFTFGETLGSGSFGSVYRVYCRDDQKIYALKILDIAKGSPGYAAVMKEANIMRALVHPNILRIFNTYESQPLHGKTVQAGIQLEFCKEGDLNNFIKRRLTKPISSKRMKIWMMQLSSALAFIHEKRIMHRDIKPANIFLDKRKDLRIGDFGVSKEMQVTLARTFIGTPTFMSPEAQFGVYGLEADVYSLGCVFLCLATLNVFPKTETGEFHKLPDPSWYGEKINSLITSCLNCEKTRRPKAREILQNVAEVDCSDNALNLDTAELEESSAAEPESLQFRQLSSGNATDSSTDSAEPVKMRRHKGRSSSRFHAVHGSSITLEAGGRIARRSGETELHGIVFSYKPVDPDQSVSIEIVETVSKTLGLVSFGFTSTDPIAMFDNVPESVARLNDLGECWSAVRYENVEKGMELRFHYDTEGRIFSTCKGLDKYRMENQILKRQTPVWAIFGFVFPVVAVQISEEAHPGIMKLKSSFPGKAKLARPYSMAVPTEMSMADYQRKQKSLNQVSQEELLKALENAKLCEDVPVVFNSSQARSEENPWSSQHWQENINTLKETTTGNTSRETIWHESSEEKSSIELTNDSLTLNKNSNFSDFELISSEEVEDIQLKTIDNPTSSSHESYHNQEIDQATSSRNEEDLEAQDKVQPLMFRFGRGQASRNPQSAANRQSFHKDSPSLAHVSVGNLMSKFQGKGRGNK